MARRLASRRAWAEHLAPTVALKTHAPAAAAGSVTVPSARSARPRRTSVASLCGDQLQARRADREIPAIQVIPMCGVGKPRMTQRDRWQKRPSVLRYRAFCDELRLRGAQLPNRYGLIFILPMLTSWSATMKAAMNGTPHLRRPDKDNLEKAVADALKPRDETIWDGAVLKYWGYAPRIIIIKRDDTSAWSPTEVCDSRWLPAGPA